MTVFAVDVSTVGVTGVYQRYLHRSCMIHQHGVLVNMFECEFLTCSFAVGRYQTSSFGPSSPGWSAQLIASQLSPTITLPFWVQQVSDPSIHLTQGFSKGVPQHTSMPRNFWTVPREKVLGKCEHIKMVCALNIWVVLLINLRELKILAIQTKKLRTLCQ